ncbi:MAG: cytochrome c maturation protein CcmE [Burkholderiaceae bacterium]
MKPRHKRLIWIAAGLATLSVSVALVLNAFQSNLVFFFTPTQIASGEAPRDRTFRIGGMVEQGSLQRAADGAGGSFRVTDTAHTTLVHYRGILPDLFKEGKGVVAQGRVEADGSFRATEVLAKHDENYMPPEAAEAMKRAIENKAAANETQPRSKTE